MINLPSLDALAQAGPSPAPIDTDALQLRARPDVVLLRVHSLRERPGDGPEFADWPTSTGGCLAGDPTVLCLRPREWLCVSDSIGPDALRERYKRIADAASTAVYDLSDGLAAVRLSGPAAPWLLAKLSGLDFLAGATAGPHCARTRMGQAAVVIHYRGRDTGGFDLYIDRSLARYLWDLLVDSAPHAGQLAGTGWPLGDGGGV
jgi:heterotetrameric sarcosine oxidase gamma subunit